MIQLSYNGVLYSYDNKRSTTVTPTTNISVLIHPYEDIEGAKLYYKQGDIENTVDIEENTAEIPGTYLTTGEVQVALKLASGSMSNIFTIDVTKIDSSGSMIDDDIQFTLDNKKRLILVPGSQSILAVQYDNESEIVTFKFPRYQEGVDLSTKIPYVNYRLPKTDELGKKLCSFDKTEEDTVYFSWVVDTLATQQEGVIKFQVEFADSEGYRWQSQIGELPILTSLYNTGLEPYSPDILEQYLKHMESMYDAYSVPSGGTTGQVLKKKSNDSYDMEWDYEEGGGEGKVFLATLETTSAEIEAARQAGKLCVLQTLSRTYIFTDVKSNLGGQKTYWFRSISSSVTYTVSLTNDEWSDDTLTDLVEQSEVGRLVDLATEAKQNLVAAINEASESDVLEAIYNATSYATINAAWEANKVVRLWYNNKELGIIAVNNGSIQFGGISQFQSYLVSVDSSDNWTANEVQLASVTALNAKYTKPSTGIPKTDLASDVQTSLGKADTALQNHQSLAAYRTAADQDVIDASLDNTFCATYRVTTFSEVQDAVNARKSCIVYVNGITYVYYLEKFTISRVPPIVSAFHFYRAETSGIYEIQLKNGESDPELAWSDPVFAPYPNPTVPQPSDDNPLMDNGDASPGISTDYARADHVHPSDSSKIGKDDGAIFANMFANGSSVTCTKGYADIYVLFASQQKTYFVLVNSQTDIQVFTIDRVDVGNRTIYLSSVVGGVLSQIVLTPSGSNAMTGTLTTINLNLQSAQGVSF